jgi:hypothetical protein
MQSVSSMTTGVMGGYKSYSRGPSFCLDVWLPDYRGILYTTIPLNVDEIVIEAAKRGFSEDLVRRRVQVIPEELVNLWIKEGSTAGPWDMTEWTFAGAHIQLDEFHHYCPASRELKRRPRWREFLSELRHIGSTLEIITQDLGNVDKQFLNLVEVQRTVINQSSSRDPYCGILMADWYELKAKAIGYWSPAVWEIEKRREDRKWKSTGYCRKLYPNPRYYECYDSYSKPHRDIAQSLAVEAVASKNESGEVVVAVKQRPSEHPYEWRSWPGLIFWFCRKNFWHFASRIFLVLLVFWVCFGGGSKHFFTFFSAMTNTIAQKQAMQKKPEEKKASPTPNPSSVVSSPLSEALPNYSHPVSECLVEITTEGLRTKFPGEGLKTYQLTTGTMQGLLSEREQMRENINGLESQVAQATGTASRIVMIGFDGKVGKNYVVFNTGEVFFDGDSVYVSGYKGKQISRIDRARGSIDFNDGTRGFVSGVSYDNKKGDSNGSAVAVASPTNKRDASGNVSDSSVKSADSQQTASKNGAATSVGVSGSATGNVGSGFSSSAGNAAATTAVSGKATTTTGAKSTTR